MTIGFDDYMAKLRKKRQRRIQKRAAELIAEEATLRQLREARERSQEEVAKPSPEVLAHVLATERSQNGRMSSVLGNFE
jgi:hypothetical protein